MRKTPLLFSLGLAALFALASCNSGKEKAKEEKPADTSAVTKPEAPKPYGKRMLVMHKVANYEKWLASFEAHDSIRLAYGIHKYVIGRVPDDSNMVVAVMLIDDPAKAKAFAGSADLKEAMKKAGVVGAPKMMLFTQDAYVDSSDLKAPLRMLIRHHVKDYDAWRKVFDSDKDQRKAAGIIDRVVSRDLDDMNMVTMAFAITDKDKAKAFGESKELQDKMKEGGVEGKGEQFYFTIVKVY
ncbi:MAG: hypothetical protein IPQ08_09605 [Chitinophagaceae bacterium]|nr:hypothetical protein [Chitinophagaceae bacterium]